jgi:hypothetical protein
MVEQWSLFSIPFMRTGSVVEEQAALPDPTTTTRNILRFVPALTFAVRHSEHLHSV